MPAPQAAMMQQLARTKFMGFSLRVPSDWQEPSGDAAKQYANAFKPEERTTAPGAPPLFQPASLNKYHTDAQKMHIGKVGKFIDDTCSAICSAWGNWQTLASFVGFVVTGPVVTVGQLMGPPLQPLILASAPKSTPMEMKYSNVIATVISTAWLSFTATIKCPGLPFYPAYAALPTPVAPPMPNMPFPIGAFTQVPVSISTNALKGQMVGQLGDPKAPFHPQLFESISFAFEQCYNLWKGTTMVTNVMAIASGGTPISPLPAAGTATMPPGGLT
jgi:hypothetical protein